MSADRRRERLAWFIAALLAVVAIFYCVAPFSVRIAPIASPSHESLDVPQDNIRADCSGPWRQLLAPPSIHATLGQGTTPFTIVQHNRQPLCKNTGRSRAIMSGWLLLAVLALIVLACQARTIRSDLARQAGSRVADLV